MTEESGIKYLDKITIPGKLKQKLRYGENPHQESRVFEIINNKSGFSNLSQLQGKELSHNNYLDTFNAYSLVNDFEKNSKICAIIKHNNPCGCASNEDGLATYLNALKCDPLSAFGGVVALNYKLSSEIAKEIIKTFYEVILAPEIDDEAKKILATKKNLRVLIYNPKKNVKNLSPTFMQKTFLLQDENISLLLKNDIKIRNES